MYEREDYWSFAVGTIIDALALILVNLELDVSQQCHRKTPDEQDNRYVGLTTKEIGITLRALDTI